jgi:hypothetical protein
MKCFEGLLPFSLFPFWVLGVLVGGVIISCHSCVCAVGQEMPKREKGKGEGKTSPSTGEWR